MEELNIEKVGQSKWGHYAKLKDGGFAGITEQVHGFLEQQCPCEIEITGQEQKQGKRLITKVKLLNSTPKPASEKRELFQKARESKSIEMLTSYAKDLFVKVYELNYQKKDFEPEESAKLCADIINTIRERVENPQKDDLIKKFLDEHDSTLKTDETKEEDLL
jgi:hypothetical protein